MWRDLCLAVRLFRRAPVFTGAAALTLALGVAANVAVFSVVNAFLLRPLPVRDASRLVVIATQDRSGPTLRGVSFADLQDYRAATPDVFEDIAAYSVGFLGLAREGAAPERVLATWVTGSYFPLLDLRPALGRMIGPNEAAPGRADAVVVLGYSAWQRRFNSDPAVVGASVQVNGRPSTIVGVAPAGFHGTFAFSDSELYLPIELPAGSAADQRAARGLHAIARLQPSVSMAQAQASMTLVADRLMQEYVTSNADVTVRVLPERLARPEEDQSRANALGAAVVMALVALVMAVAALNVTALLVARVTSRQQEIAIRLALGAGRWHIVRQHMAESGLLAWLGGTAGLLLGSGAARILAGTMRVPGDLPVRFDFSLDWRGAGYAVAAIAAAGLLMGLVSSAHALSGAAAPSLRRVGARSSGGQRTRRVLVAGQVAACVVLLVIAGLFVRSLGAAQDADLGFNPHGVLNVHMDVGQLGHTETEGRAFFDEAERRARSLPGVQAASFALTVPMGYVRVEETVESESQADGNPVTAGQNIVGAAYFEVMGIRLTRGRGFTGSDNEAAPPVAIVNQRLGDMLWPGEDPVGGRLRSSDAAAMSVQVVGVVETGRYGSLFEEPQPYFYRPMAQAYSGMRVLQVRTQMAPEALVPSIERTMRALEPNLPLYDVQTMVQALGSGRGFFPLRVGASVAAALGIMGLSLAIVGVYGVVSYATVQRRRELGIRLAIGAAPRDVIGMVLRDGLTLLSLGIAIGLVAALACSRFVGSLLFGVGAHDAGTYAAVSAVLLCAGLAACLIPAWQAAAVDPKTALHSE